MKSNAHAEIFADVPERSIQTSLLEFVTHVFAVANAEFVKLKHDPLELLMRAVQPILWLVIFGNVMGAFAAWPWERSITRIFLLQAFLRRAFCLPRSSMDFGYLGTRSGHRSSVSRESGFATAILLGKQVSASIRGLSQAAIIYVIALVMGLGISFQPLKMVGVVILISLGSGLFANLSLIIACIVKTRERFMGIGQVITMPNIFREQCDFIRSISCRAGSGGWQARIRSRMKSTDCGCECWRTAVINPSGLARDFSVLFVISVVLLEIASACIHEWQRDEFIG